MLSALLQQAQQPEALRLADQLLDMSGKFKTPSNDRGVCNGAIQELRRLHAENEKLRAEFAKYAQERPPYSNADAGVYGSEYVQQEQRDQVFAELIRRDTSVQPAECKCRKYGMTAYCKCTERVAQPAQEPLTQLPKGDILFFDGRGDAVDGYSAQRVWEILAAHGIGSKA